MIKRVSFFKIIVSTFILILLLNNFSTIVVYASTEDISEDENNIEMISENKNTEENNEEIIGVKEEVEKNITEEVIQKDEDIEKDDVEIISKDIPKDQEENKEIINKEEIENIKKDNKDKSSIYTESGILYQYDKLWQKNNDMIGWIHIDGTNIDYPILYRENDSKYYLRKGFDKNMHIVGAYL